MSLIHYKPFQNRTVLNKDFEQLLQNFFGETNADQSNVVTSQWTPHVDIKEEAARFVILADIPGVDPNDIEIHMEKGILTIKGERASEVKEESDKFTRVERSRGTFYRRFALPDSADGEGVKAAGKHGVLEITIPKKAETAARRIKIEAN